MIIVLDTTSFVSGVFWRTEAHQVLRAFSEGRLLLAYSQEVYKEYAMTVGEVRVEEELSIDPKPWLDAVIEFGFEFEPASMTQQVCRDPDDDKFISCAVSAQANAIVSRDRDLLVLESPSGFQCSRHDNY